ncbi:hypothetical protein [Mammaliicoccus sciuri]|uniref:hypothetical protein n=1 Tax=Mammaliicoccus sciuri TaxID=1296 RepID=UPI00374FA767
MGKLLKYIIVGVLAIAAITLLIFNIKTTSANNDLKSKINDVNVQKKKNVDVGLTQSEVTDLEKVVKTKMDDFLRGQYKDDKTGEGSAYDVMQGLFAVTSHNIIIKEDSSEKDIVDYYAPFDYKVTNISGRKTNDGKEVMMNVEVTYDDKRINEYYSLIKFELDENNNFTGGMLYGEEK